MKESDRVRLGHMLDASRKAVKLVRGRTRPDLDTDEVIGLALVRLLEVVGEAARAVSQEMRKSTPQIPWKEVSGTRDRLVHGYFDVDYDIVWSIITADLPPLIAVLESLIGEGASG